MSNDFDLQAFLSYLRFQRHVVDYLFISAGAIFLYDWVLTLHLEVKLIWFSRWSYTKVLFLVLRYMTFVSVWMSIINVSFLGRTQEVCRRTSPVQTWFLLMGIFVSEVILAVRTWAVWRQNKFIGFGLSALTIAHLVVQCVMLSRYTPSLGYAPPPYPGFRGCFVTKASGLLWVNYTAMAIVEAIVLALMAVSAVRSYRRGSNGELSHIIHRDGIQLYIYLLLISVTNVVIMKALPFEDTVLLAFLQQMIYPVLTARIVLNIRDVGSRGLQTELHTGYHQHLMFATPMKNLPPSQQEEPEEMSWSESSMRWRDSRDNQYA